jgi:biotin transporter BioY
MVGGKMGWKEFFKPTIGKIVIFLILFFLTSYIWMNYKTLLPEEIPKFGVPFGFYSKATSYIGMEYEKPIIYFNFLNLIIDLIFWCLISCLIILIYNKLKIKNKKKKK